ncbi:hypothetical protein EJ03DRAFT_203521 [Teratosphaeria nubilosa]|uniref:Uncharacterized protein n=1 Tax=Teratosphaeria nubilosa TaxID=161662 RepID=A0A6G1LIZ9_9PEZI|nr:hypothetical protein EJ03DRAFT_203521 [Teratosphaeria nubilosa]
MQECRYLSSAASSMCFMIRKCHDGRELLPLSLDLIFMTAQYMYFVSYCSRLGECDKVFADASSCNRKTRIYIPLPPHVKLEPLQSSPLIHLLGYLGSFSRYQTYEDASAQLYGAAHDHYA